VEDKWFEKAELREPEPFEKKEPLKIESGVHEIRCMDDGKEVMIPDFNDPSKEVKKLVLGVKHNGEEKAWFVTVGQTTESLFGQIAKIAKRKGSLKGTDLKVVVAGRGKSKRYTITDVDGRPVE